MHLREKEDYSKQGTALREENERLQPLWKGRQVGMARVNWGKDRAKEGPR